MLTNILLNALVEDRLNEAVNIADTIVTDKRPTWITDDIIKEYTDKMENIIKVYRKGLPNTPRAYAFALYKESPHQYSISSIRSILNPMLTNTANIYYNKILIDGKLPSGIYVYTDTVNRYILAFAYNRTKVVVWEVIPSQYKIVNRGSFAINIKVSDAIKSSLKTALFDESATILTEASKKDDNADDAKDDASTDNAADTNLDDIDADDAKSDDKGNEDDANNEDNADEGNDEDKNEENDENKDDENNDEEKQEDDFNLDDDESFGDENKEDDEPNPDGLPNPDDDGSNDINEGEEVETNVHTNILDLSKLDRALAKKKCYQDFMDLRATIAGLLNIIARNETVIEPETREDTVMELNKLNSSVEDFIKYRFGILNYEDALQHYFIFVKSLNMTVNTLKAAGLTKN